MCLLCLLVLESFPQLLDLLVDSQFGIQFESLAVSGLGLVNILLALHDAHRHLTDAGEGS